jgi:hypothetical protein
MENRRTENSFGDVKFHFLMNIHCSSNEDLRTHID